MKKTIKFTVDKEGKVIFDFNGFQSTTCLAEFQKLLAELSEAGIEIERRDTRMKTGTLGTLVKEVMMQ